VSGRLPGDSGSAAFDAARDEESIAPLALADDLLAVQGFEARIAHRRTIEAAQQEALPIGRDEKRLMRPGTLRAGPVRLDFDAAFDAHEPIVTLTLALASRLAFA
jgi:hypothetical protein